MHTKEENKLRSFQSILDLPTDSVLKHAMAGGVQQLLCHDLVNST